MPAALSWDQPNLSWDSTATWDAATAPTLKTMNTTKAIINFRDYTAPDLSPVAQHIHDKMTENAVTFTAPTTTMANLQTLITDYDAKLVARASNATEDVMKTRGRGSGGALGPPSAGFPGTSFGRRGGLRTARPTSDATFSGHQRSTSQPSTSHSTSHALRSH